MNKDQREIARKLRILQHADETGHVAKTCRYFGIGRSSFYRWREAYRKHGEGGGLVAIGQRVVRLVGTEHERNRNSHIASRRPQRQ